MSMTKKQARAYIDDVNNWKTIIVFLPIRLSTLSFRGRHWVKIELRKFSQFRNKFGMNEELYWFEVGKWEYDPNKKAAEDQTSLGTLTDQVWELDKDEA